MEEHYNIQIKQDYMTVATLLKYYSNTNTPITSLKHLGEQVFSDYVTHLVDSGVELVESSAEQAEWLVTLLITSRKRRRKV